MGLVGFFEKKAISASVPYLLIILGMLSFHVLTGSIDAWVRGRYIVNSDMASHAAAFNIFLQSPWGWPLGANPRYGGSNIIYTDSVPIYALLAKLLFTLSGGKAALNFPFYSVITVVLNSIFAWKLAKQLCTTTVFRTVLASLLLLNVNWAARALGAQHTGLASYWILLWGMEFFARGIDSTQETHVFEALALPTIGFLVHPYLGAIVIVFVLCALTRQRRFSLVVATLAMCALALLAMGAFNGTVQKYPAPGWAKAYSLDIGAYLNSMGWGILPVLFHTNPAQSDNAMYLGSGSIFLGLCMLLLCLFLRLSQNDQSAEQQKKKAWSVLGVSGLLVMFASAFSLRFFGNLAVSFEILFPFSKLYEIFRVPGRFGLPFAFSLIGFLVFLSENVARRSHLSAANGIVLFGLLSIAIQFADVTNASTHTAYRFPALQSEASETKSAVTALTHEENNWNGRVYKIVPLSSLEQMQLIDYQLQKNGAKYFNAVQSARMVTGTYDYSMLKSGYRNGDLVIWQDFKKMPKTCVKPISIRSFGFCITRS